VANANDEVASPSVIRSDLMRHMVVGRLVSQHAMLFEPLVFGAHLVALSRLVRDCVLTPTEAGTLARYRTEDIALVRMAELTKVEDGGWSAFAASAGHARLDLSHGQHGVLMMPDVRHSLPALREMTAFLDEHGLSVFLELGVGALVAAVPATDCRDQRDALLLSPGGRLGAESTEVEDLLFETFASVLRIWAVPEPEIAAQLSDVLHPVTIEDLFVAGCAIELADRARLHGIDLARRFPAIGRHARWVEQFLPPAAHLAACEWKAYSLLAELLLCWWPNAPKVIHLFTSQLDYLTRHPGSAWSRGTAVARTAGSGVRP
jgi:hypothetical protein